MATGLQIEFAAEEMDEERYRAVNDRVNAAGDPPDGLIFHSAGPGPNGGWRVVDVWQSRDHFDRFQQERLFPALGEVFGGPPASPPQITEWEVVDHNYAG